MRERYQVRAVSGYRIKLPIRRHSGRLEVGVSASVLDSLNGWREVARFDSEDYEPGQTRKRLGRGAVIGLAKRRANELNAALG